MRVVGLERSSLLRELGMGISWVVVRREVAWSSGVGKESLAAPLARVFEAERRRRREERSGVGNFIIEESLWD